MRVYNSQWEYDNAEPDFSDYQEEKKFAEFVEFVTIELLAGRDWQNLSSEILMIDLECLGGGYRMALEWVCEKLTEDQYLEWVNDLVY